MPGKSLSFAPEYSVTRDGKVFSNGKQLNPSKTQFGGQKVDVNGKTYLVHRLVAHAYLGLDLNDPKAFVQHGDDNQQNNSVKNLSIGTNSSNTADKVSKNRQFRPEGELNSQAKLTAKDVGTIKRAVKQGVTQAELSRRYKISEAQVSRIVNGLRW